MKDVGIRIRTVREKFLLSQEEMAKSFLISRNQLSELENGRRTPPGPFLIALESLFMVSKKWLLTGKGEMVEGGGKIPWDANDNVVNLLRHYRVLSGEGRRKLMQILKVLMMVDKKERHS